MRADLRSPPDSDSTRPPLPRSAFRSPDLMSPAPPRYRRFADPPIWRRRFITKGKNGLQFPVGRYLKLGRYSRRVGTGSPVSLAGAAEKQIGEVVGSNNLKRPRLDGIRYDYVYANGLPLRKLPHKASAHSSKPTFKHIPESGMHSFGSAIFGAYLRKILVFNLYDGSEELTLDHNKIARLHEVVKILKDKSNYNASSFAADDIDLLFKLLDSWPVSMLFPVIDLVRLIILHPDGSAKLCKYINDGNDALKLTIRKVTESPMVANLQTTFRLVANLFTSPCFHKWLQNSRLEVLDAFSNSHPLANKYLQFDYSTVILNYAVLLIANKDEEGQLQVLSAALEIAEADNVDVKSKYQALVAIGSLMLEGIDKRMAVDDFFMKLSRKAAEFSTETILAEVWSDIERLMRHMH